MTMRSIADRARAGEPLRDVLIIDCHTHMGRWPNFHIPHGGNAESMLQAMDTVGIDVACVTAMASVGPDYRYGNDLVMDALRRYPERFVGYVTINPHYPDGVKAELDRCFAVPGMKGIKVHQSFHGVTIDYKTYHPAYETAEERGCPVLIHVWGHADVAAASRIAAHYPGAQIIMAHAGAEVRAMEEAIAAVNRLDNAYVDLALSLAYEGNVEWFVREMGAHKILFGTDMPFFDPRPTFGRVALADIQEEEKRAIFGLNMKRLLKLE
ncbi:amidohydrolase family protein [Paenibacillus cymbidii]|uniref:amidohydrolase family protein n=1 Tax=Paenibacillus cymbidii TaxID=1639034 RepID=UPI0014366FD0|nr:amidohydrolase family protein [Paenibacillus cymbidii]